MNDMKSIRFPPPVADDMIRAILEGRKTVTRRAVKQSTVDKFVLSQDNKLLGSFDNRRPEWEVYPTIDDSPYRSGDILYVRETWHQTPNGQYWYKADSLCVGCTEDGICLPKGVLPHKNCKLCDYVGDYYFIKWRSSIHMPREAARLFLRVTDVRVERLHDMTMGDILAEGVVPQDVTGGQWQQWACDYNMCPVWDSTIKKPADRALYGWAANPWVWVIAFERCGKPEEKPSVGDTDNG